MADWPELGPSHVIGFANQKFGNPGLFRRVSAKTHPHHDLFDEFCVAGAVELGQDDRVSRPADILHKDFDYSPQDSIPARAFAQILPIRLPAWLEHNCVETHNAARHGLPDREPLARS
jgi:hypothetical protein